MITYLLQVSFCWVFFYLVFHLFLKRETFFSINRWYLLSTLIVSLFIPVIGQWIKDLSTTYPIDTGQLLFILSETPAYIDHRVIHTPKIDWLAAITIAIYGTGVIIAFVRFIWGLIRIFRLYRSGSKIHQKGFTLVMTDKYHLPFSFFNLVFFSRKDPLKREYEKIILHELTHVQQWHSVDVLLTELLQVFFWFNPILIFYKRAIRQMHEYHADLNALQNQHPENYAQLLLYPAISQLEMALVNQFFNSQLKNRITMMYRKKSAPTAQVKYLVVVPILILSLFIFSNSALKTNDDPIPFKREVKALIEHAPSIDSLSLKVRKVIDQYLTQEKADLELINQYLREIGRETGIIMEFMFGKSLNFSFEVDIARQAGTLDVIYRLNKVPAIFNKLDDVLQQSRGLNPLLKINDYVMYGNWYSVDAERILNHSYTAPKEAMELYGDIASGGIINLELSDFSLQDAASIGVILHSNSGQQNELMGEVWEKVDQLPRYPGCSDIDGVEAQACAMERYNEYIAQMLQYPDLAMKHGVEGTVMVRFVVTENGQIGNPQIIRDIGAGCGEEALYLIQNMNNLADGWTPARKDGKPVRATITLPVKFNLEGEVSKKEFSAMHETNLNGEVRLPMPEILKDASLSKKLIAQLGEFVINPRPIFIVDGKIMEKDSIKLRTDQIQKIELLNEKAAAEKYGTVKQRALEISTQLKEPDNTDKSPEAISAKKETDIKVLEQVKPFINDLSLYPNPAKNFLQISFSAPAEPLEIQVHDLSGKLLFRENILDFSGTLNRTIRSDHFVNTEALLSIIQNGQIMTKGVIFSK